MNTVLPRPARRPRTPHRPKTRPRCWFVIADPDRLPRLVEAEVVASDRTAVLILVDGVEVPVARRACDRACYFDRDKAVAHYRHAVARWASALEADLTLARRREAAPVTEDARTCFATTTALIAGRPAETT